MDIGKRIKEVRQEKDLSQGQVASKLGMKQSQYSRIENRTNNISFDLLERIAGVLGVSVKYLLFDEDHQSDSNEVLLLRTQLELDQKNLLSLQDNYEVVKQRLQTSEIQLLYCYNLLMYKSGYAAIDYKLDYATISDKFLQVTLSFLIDTESENPKTLAKCIWVIPNEFEKIYGENPRAAVSFAYTKINDPKNFMWIVEENISQILSNLIEFDILGWAHFHKKP